MSGGARRARGRDGSRRKADGSGIRQGGGWVRGECASSQWGCQGRLPSPPPFPRFLLTVPFYELSSSHIKAKGTRTHARAQHARIRTHTRTQLHQPLLSRLRVRHDQHHACTSFAIRQHMTPSLPLPLLPPTIPLYLTLRLPPVSARAQRERRFGERCAHRTGKRTADILTGTQEWKHRQFGRRDAGLDSQCDADEKTARERKVCGDSGL